VEALLDLSGGVVILTIVAVAWTGFRLASDEERRRMLWIVLAQLTVAGFTVASLMLSLLWNFTGSEAIRFLRAFFGVVYHPLIWFVDLSGFALAIFYAGAFDLRPVINKTTVYGGLFLVLTFLFATVEQVAQNLLTDRLGVPDGFGAWLGAGTIAVAMGPVRERLERFIRGLGRALAEDLGAGPSDGPGPAPG
jgi:NADH:ubiquinone oxidoreductase subunit 6 (subunit J)